MLATHAQKPRCSSRNLQQLKELSPPTYDPSNGQSKPDSVAIHLIREFSRSSFEEKGRAILKRFLFLKERQVLNGEPPPERDGPPQPNAGKEQKEDYGHRPLNTSPSGPHMNSSRAKKPLMRERFKLWKRATIPISLTTTPAAAVTPPPSKGGDTKALPERRIVSAEQHVQPNLDPAASTPTNDHPSINSNPVTEQHDACGERRGGVGPSVAPSIRPDVGQVKPTGNRDDHSERVTPSKGADSPGTRMGALHDPDGRSTSLASVVVSGHKELPDDSLQNDKNLVLPVNSPMIYHLGQGLYVGKMQEITPPWDMAIKWQDDIRVRLVQDLIPVALGLPRSNNSDDLIIEPELCMTGATVGKSLTVRLEPTVWIRCGGKAGRKAVRKAVSHLDYLHAFSKGQVQVQLRGPRLASHEQNNLSTTGSEIANTSAVLITDSMLRIQRVSDSDSACGLRLKITFTESGVVRTRICTVGGLLYVNGNIYGLTTGHALIISKGGDRHTSVMESSPRSASSESNSDGELSDTDSSVTVRPSSTSHSKGVNTPVHSVQHEFNGRLEGMQWTRVQLHTLCSFGNIFERTHGIRTAPNRLSCADFSLLSMNEGLLNTYYGTRSAWEKSFVRGVIHEEELSAGGVLILAGHSEVLDGYLPKSTSLFIYGDTVVHTRKIQLSAPLARGSSGSWVVRDGLLCGCIVAVYDAEPYAHMIPADKMLSDIARFYGVNDDAVRVATEDDVLRGNLLHAPAQGITPAPVSEQDPLSVISSSLTVITSSRVHKLFQEKSKHRLKRVPTPSAKKQYNFEQYERFRNRRLRKSEQRKQQGLGYPLALMIQDWLGAYCLGHS